jgi:hypothetical protein
MTSKYRAREGLCDNQWNRHCSEKKVYGLLDAFFDFHERSYSPIGTLRGSLV